jgi:hypothetical protein
VFTGRQFEDIRRALDEIPIIDTHEHYGAEWDAPGTTLYTLFRESCVEWVAHNDELADSPESLRAWLDDVLAMASERPNLIVDTCWLPIISPSAAVRFYTEYPEVASRPDTLLWAGDNWHAEETYGAALTFKDCLTKAVADKVEGGYWTRREGLRFAEGVMWRAGETWFDVDL